MLDGSASADTATLAVNAIGPRWQTMDANATQKSDLEEV
jgi:hypothetical protein